jgi:hypothetical protein
MATQNVSLIKTKTRMIDGLSIRYAESPLRHGRVRRSRDQRFRA